MKTLSILLCTLLLITGSLSAENDQFETNEEPRSLTGECRTVMPDGRIQTASFTCAPDGFKTVIKYVRKKPITTTTVRPASTTTAKADHRFVGDKTDKPRTATTKRPPLPMRARKLLL